MNTVYTIIFVLLTSSNALLWWNLTRLAASHNKAVEVLRKMRDIVQTYIEKR